MSELTNISLHGIRAAIFDMDGTMINNSAHHRKAWEAFLLKHGIVLSDAEYKQKVSGRRNDQILELVFGKKLDKAAVDTYAGEKEALYRELYSFEIKEITGLSYVIDALQAKNIQTAIATTAPLKNREFALEALGLKQKFPVVLGEEHTQRGKPDPEIYLLTAQALKVDSSECIVFEDSPAGVQAAKAAGMQVIGILSSHSAETLNQADHQVKDFSALRFTA